MPTPVQLIKADTAGPLKRAIFLELDTNVWRVELVDTRNGRARVRRTPCTHDPIFGIDIADMLDIDDLSALMAAELDALAAEDEGGSDAGSP